MPAGHPERQIARLMTQQEMTLAVAESCTGGLIGWRLTSVPGSSRWFCGGVTAYLNRIKTDYLGVDPEIIDRVGAVSAPTAAQMARGVRKLMKSALGLSVTGIAGPGGGTPVKPVGLVFTALAFHEGETVARRMFEGDRAAVRESAASSALEILHEYLLKREARAL
ncbi:MAG: nicotinamide-nucleotide amidohydrolase family protein [Kiritimatiellia bacterium]